MKSRSSFLSPVPGLLFSGALLAAPKMLAQTMSWQIAGAGGFQTSTTGFELAVVTHAVPEPHAWVDLAFMVVMVLGSRLIRWRMQPR
jgi:hypothetical protein